MPKFHSTAFASSTAPEYCIDMSTLKQLITLSTGQESALLLMAVPFMFLAVVIPWFIFWLRKNHSTDDVSE
jgi:hypothetical protein